MNKKDNNYLKLRKDCFKNAKRIVIKVGSNVLTGSDGLNIKAIRRLTIQLCDLIDKKKEIIIVSSGAMASGMRKLGITKRPDEIPKKQAIAAVGQARLIRAYDRAFGFFDKKVAQILLTADDLANRRRYLNARNTIHELLSWDVVPIVNENDTVVVEEIKFGDNDNLSAMISLLMEVDILINITDIKGLYNMDPRLNPNAVFINEVTNINKEIEEYAGGIPGTLGTGGMLTKVKAAKKVTHAGIPMIIAQERENIIKDLFEGKQEGTFFIPKIERMSCRKCWIAFNLKPKGTVKIDDGAASAIINKGKSLLPVGIIRTSGEFNIGDPVVFESLNGTKIGVGLVNYNSSDVKKLAGLDTKSIKKKYGKQPYDDIIHRNNMAITIDNECKTQNL